MVKPAVSSRVHLCGNYGRAREEALPSVPVFVDERIRNYGRRVGMLPLQILDGLDTIQFEAVMILKSLKPLLVFGRVQSINFRHADLAEEINGAEYDVWLLNEVIDIPRDFYKETSIRVIRVDMLQYLPYSLHLLTWNPTTLGVGI